MRVDKKSGAYLWHPGMFLMLFLLSGCQQLPKIEQLNPMGYLPDLQFLGQTPAPEKHINPPKRIDSYVIQEGSDIVGELRIVTSNYKDTLLDIGRRYGLGYNEITSANPSLDPWLPGQGTHVVLPTRFILPPGPRKGIVVNVATMRLFYYPEHHENTPKRVITHPVGIGRENWSTPIGKTTVIGKTVNPYWTVPQSIRIEHAQAHDPLPAVVPPGPSNPLGTRAMRLGFNSYLIHGTNRPSGIGKRVSHGCIQLYPEDIESLFEDVPVGTPVRIINQPYHAGWHNGQLYLQAHKPLIEQQMIMGKSVKPIAKVLRKALAKRDYPQIKLDWKKINRITKQGRLIPIPITSDTTDIDDIIALAPIYDLTAGENNKHPSSYNRIVKPLLGQWFVQTGSFRMPGNAVRLAQMLNHMGPPIPARNVQVEGFHRVIAGPFQTQAEAKKNAERIRSTFGGESLILKQGG